MKKRRNRRSLPLRRRSNLSLTRFPNAVPGSVRRFSYQAEKSERLANRGEDLDKRGPMTLAKSQYRPDIDGLRALAVLAVLVFHIDPVLLPGGFLGVDVFFVISGFLITSIIAREIQAGEFSFVRFYERRIRRIVPALVVVLVATTLAALVWWFPAELESYSKALKFVMLSLGNVHFLDAFQDYFNDEARRAPLLHTWSLAVEEQYYFVFPILLFFLFRGLKNWRRVTLILTGLLFLSLGLCVWRGIDSPMVSFFLLPFRAWEMLVGSFLAMSRFRVSNEKTASYEGVIGLGLVLGSFVFFAERQFVPGLSALPSCVGAALLLRSGARPESVIAKVLSWKPLVFVGLISYSVYLWHWPLIVFAKSLWGEGRHGLRAPSLFAVSLLLGWASWKWVEQPFRRPQKIGAKGVWLFWGATTVSLLLIGAGIREAEGLPRRFPVQVRELLEFKERRSKLKPDNKKHLDPKRAPVYGDDSVKPSVALWGDSHAEALIPELDRLAKEDKKSFKYYGFPGQPPVSGLTRVLDGPVEKRAIYTEKVLEEITGDAAISVVVLHGRWSVLNRGRNESPNEGLFPIYQRTFHGSEELDAYYLERIGYTVDKLLAAGKRVIFVGPVPEIGVDVPDLLARQAMWGENLSTTAKCGDFARRHGYLLDALNSLKKRDGVLVILPHERLLTGDDAKISFEGKPLYRDDDHLSEAGTNYLWDLWRPIFLQNREGLATSPTE
jgi:peptidoglycan/LPS O-acetylase OafA/YrhL